MVQHPRNQAGGLRVAIGPVFDEFGGMSQHIHAISNFSSNCVVEIPSGYVRLLTTAGPQGYARSKGYRQWLYQRAMNIVGLKHFDVVHSHAQPWFVDICSKSRGDASWVHTYHTLFYFEEDYPDGLSQRQEATNRSLTRVAPNADLRISVSNWLHDYLLSRYSIRTQVVPNGVSLADCQAADPRRFQKKFRAKDFILFVGSMLPMKNPTLFIRLAEKMPNHKFVMLGKGVNPRNIRERLGQQVPSNLVAIDEVSHKDALDAIAACRVFVMTSKREGLPTALLEAMALSKPVVVPAHTGCKEVVQSERYGYMYASESIDDLMDKMDFALSSAPVSENARARVVENYDWSALIQKIDAIYESLC